jgi:PAS domain S-box-containing protein
MNKQVRFHSPIRFAPLAAGIPTDTERLNEDQILALLEENTLLRKEIRVARESAEITASLVVRQFEETERILHRFQEANAQRKTVLDSAVRLAIIATNQNGTIIVFNKGAENLLQYPAREIIGKTSPLAFHDPVEIESRADSLGRETNRRIEGIQVFFEFAAKAGTQQQEWTYIRKDGSRFPVSMSINALRNPEGSVSGFLCIASDITEKRRSEKALLESERNYRLLIANIPNIVFKATPDGHIHFFDDKIEKLTGYRKEEFNSRSIRWVDLMVEEDRPASSREFIEAMTGEGAKIREYRIRKKNGDMVWVEGGSQIVFDENGNIDFITGAFLDVSERKAAERALHESEEKYRSLFDSGPNPIFVLDMGSLQILDANPSAEETYRYTKEELLGRPFTDLGEFEYEEKGSNSATRASLSQACVVSQRARHRKKDNTYFYIRVIACPIRYKGRNAIILAATDITESIEKDAQLFQASKMKTLGEMSAGIAHELNQPLNAIKIGSDFLKRMIDAGKTISGDDLVRVAASVSSQVERASNIVNRLREFGRKPDFKKERILLNDTFNQVLGIMGQQLSLENIKITVNLQPDLPKILANANRLEQVLFNLMTNARDAIEQRAAAQGAKEPREITVRSSSKDEKVVFSVTDTGVGIPEESMDKIFEPFYTTKEVGRGMGLGLSITYGIVREFGGSIEVASEPGMGTQFTLKFPATVE